MNINLLQIIIFYKILIIHLSKCRDQYMEKKMMDTYMDLIGSSGE